MEQAITRTRHGRGASPQLLPRRKIDAYDAAVAGSSDIRRFRLDDDTWDAYGDLVGDGGRSADLKAYIEWRLDNPETPLPGKRRGPLKKSRTPRAAAKAQAEVPTAEG